MISPLSVANSSPGVSVPAAQSGRSGASSDASSADRTSGLTPDQQREVERLKRIDARVRAHEAAHQAAGGGLVRGSVSFSYVTGPDGRRYAVGGEVSIDASPASTPEATVAKAEAIRAAALAPADPSGQDRRVAAAATEMEAEARREIRQETTGAVGGKTGTAIAAYRQVAAGGVIAGFSAEA